MSERARVMADSLFKTHLASFRVVVILVALRVLSLRPAAWQVGKEAEHVSRIKSARENGEQRLECSGRAACVAQLWVHARPRVRVQVFETDSGGFGRPASKSLFNRHVPFPF